MQPTHEELMALMTNPHVASSMKAVLLVKQLDEMLQHMSINELNECLHRFGYEVQTCGVTLERRRVVQ